MLKIYGIKNCTTVRKALAWLDDAAIAHEFIDYKKAGVAAQCLPDWNARLGWENILNRRGLTWKKLPEAERAAIDEPRALRLMAAMPTLIKRPLFDTGDELLTGFTPEVAARLKEKA